MPAINKKNVGVTGFGLMGFTWRPTQTPDEQAFAALKEALKHSANFWNAGEFYGTPTPTLNLELLNRYFQKYPEDADKVVLSIKGGINLETFSPDGSKEGIARSIGNIIKHLGTTKRIDIFECARVDKSTPIEETIGYLAEYVKDGTIGGIGLSEVSAATIRRAATVHPIAAVELELSLWSTGPLDNGAAKACAELGIPIVAYSPLGRGLLTGQIKKLDDLPADDRRRTFDRFQPDTFAANLAILDAIEAFAANASKRSGRTVTTGQLALAWVRAISEAPGLPVVIPIPGATTAARVEENTANPYRLSVEEKKELDGVLAKFDVKGGRYNQHVAHTLEG
ncbi:Pyridoxine 4-dehydrogenase [Thoreauomyces humboldtii]|nr:Pyridoxine 4-dehydrogenase [Thoreauomyces humboldtii]